MDDKLNITFRHRSTETPVELSDSLQLGEEVLDQFDRPLRELRVSVIDRCNFRCTYCMPADSLQGQGVFLPLVELMTDHELVRAITAFASLGVHKLRITGGEPLVRPGLPGLIAQLRDIPGIDQIAMTTNGVLLPRLAGDLAQAGLSRITVSLDTLDQQVLHTMSGGKGKLPDIIAGIEAAEAEGFQQLKINTVVQRGVNDHTVMDLLDHFRGSGHIVRLIEFMDVGNVNHWASSQVVPSAEWVERIDQRWPLNPVERASPSETANRYVYADGQGEVGFISSISQPFCGGCSRARITADGMLYTCLFASQGTDLMPMIRQNQDQSEDIHALQTAISNIWRRRTDRYSELRDTQSSDSKAAKEKVEMYRIGG